MDPVYPKLVAVDNSTITVNTVNIYNQEHTVRTFDLSDQIPAHDDNNFPEGKFIFTLPFPAKRNSIIITLDGLVLSPQDSPQDLGDYRILNTSSFEFIWDTGLKRASADDTPVLLARYSIDD